MKRKRDRVVRATAVLLLAGLVSLGISADAVAQPECPPDGIVEGETPCSVDYIDGYNGGCGSSPIAFMEIEPSDDPITICGESGTYLQDGLETRDTDWYEIAPAETSVIALCAVAEYPVMILLLDGREGCAGYEMLKFAIGDVAMEEVCLVDTVPPGTYWLWTAPSLYAGVPCGSQYLLTVSGYREGATTSVAGFDHPVPGVFAVVNSPNPFNPSTSIRFTVPERARIDLTVYDAAGRRITVLTAGDYEAGDHIVSGNGRDGAGGEIPSGVYFARLHAGEHTATSRMVLVK